MNDNIQQEKRTIIDRFDALMRLLPKDDKISFNNSLNRIHTEITNYLDSTNQNGQFILEKAKETCIMIDSKHKEYLNNLQILVGKKNAAAYVTIQAIFTTIILLDPETVPSPKHLTMIYNAFVPRLQISNGYDPNRTIRKQWKSQIENTSDDFIRQLHQNASRPANSDDVFTHLDWDCESVALKKQVHTILYGKVSPQFSLHDNTNLNITALRTLRPKSFISDFIVSHFSELVQTEDEHAVYKVYHVSDHELKERHRNKSYWEKKYKSTSKISLGSRKLILLFPRCNDTHFTIYKVFGDKPTDNTKIRIGVEEYNSLRTRTASITYPATEKLYEDYLSEFYMKFLQTHCQDEHFDISVDYEIETNIGHLEIPQQKNGYDCGVFCILYMCALTNSIQLNLHEINQEYIDHNHLRNWILASIINKRILFPPYKISPESD